MKGFVHISKSNVRYSLIYWNQQICWYTEHWWEIRYFLKKERIYQKIEEAVEVSDKGETLVEEAKSWLEDHLHSDTRISKTKEYWNSI